MESNSTGNKRFMWKISLLYACILASAWLAKSQESMHKVLDMISSSPIGKTAPMLMQMINKWYFIGF